MLYAKKLVIVANNLPTKYQYSFSDQLRRAALSIPSNIAEGAGRKSKRDSGNFYSIARGSVYESVNILKLLEDLKEISFRKTNLGLKTLFSDAEEIVKMLYGLSR
jgi:four helix bundle protein